MNFYESIAPYYHHIFPFKQPQLDFVLNTVSKHHQNSLLDIGCGTGILSSRFAEHFCQVTAIDLDPEMISCIKPNPRLPHLNFQVLDMLKTETTFGAKAFNVVVSFGNTIVHLQSLEPIGELFRQVFTMLKPKGKFLFQIINYDRILAEDIDQLPTIENEEIRFERKYNYLKSEHKIEFLTKLLVKSEEKTIENKIQLFPLRKAEIEDLLLKFGFQQIEFHGNFQKQAFSSTSFPLIVEAEK